MQSCTPSGKEQDPSQRCSPDAASGLSYRHSNSAARLQASKEVLHDGASWFVRLQTCVEDILSCKATTGALSIKAISSSPPAEEMANNETESLCSSLIGLPAVVQISAEYANRDNLSDIPPDHVPRVVDVVTPTLLQMAISV